MDWTRYIDGFVHWFLGFSMGICWAYGRGLRRAFELRSRIDDQQIEKLKLTIERGVQVMQQQNGQAKDAQPN